MTEIATRDAATLELMGDPTGGRLVAWAQAASAANQLAKALTTTSFVPAVFRGNVGDATAAILMGDELGLSPLAALRSIYVVHGTPAMYARTMVALAQSQGHQIWTEATSDQRVIVCGKRRGSEKVERAEWTIQRAQKAGYTSNKKYASTPQEMLYAKAAGEIARKVAADVLAGVPMSVEDIELDEDAAPATTTVQRGATRRVSRAKADPAPEPPEPEFDAPAPADGLDEFHPDTTSNPAESTITEAQSRKMFALYHEVGIEDRAERMADAASVVGRDIASSAELTKAEAVRLIDDLERRVQDKGDGELFPGAS